MFESFQRFVVSTHEPKIVLNILQIWRVAMGSIQLCCVYSEHPKLD